MRFAEAQREDLLTELPEEDRLRAAFYRLLAVLLSSPPSIGAINACAALTPGEGSLGRAVAGLAEAARLSDLKALTEEYHELFIGLGRGELVPYGSYYLTGFLHEKPLARLRQDLARLGVTAAATTSDPEDHISAVLDTMAGLIDGRFGDALDLVAQEQFYSGHIGTWAPVFFADLERVGKSSFYASVGAVGRSFLAIERAAFEMGS